MLRYKTLVRLARRTGQTLDGIGQPEPNYAETVDVIASVYPEMEAKNASEQGKTPQRRKKVFFPKGTGVKPGDGIWLPEDTASEGPAWIVDSAETWQHVESAVIVYDGGVQ